MQSLSFIPSIHQILSESILDTYKKELSHIIVSYRVKQIVAEYKQNIIHNNITITSKTQATQELLILILNALQQISQTKTQRVINATGIALHTNLGRSPLHADVLTTIIPKLTHYSSLELDLNNGKRGKRKSLIPALLVHTLQQDPSQTDVVVVNNNAAAMLLLLATFPKGKEVIVSRGEQVQIGGGFRIPDILDQAGLILKEVGTTNITTLADYQKAITENTVMILKIHTSNFTIQGFTQSVSTKELAQICPPYCVLAVDQGSGLLKEDKFGEVSVAQHLQSGAHIVLFSGDKILGGVQAGLAIGQKNIVQAMEKHPLMRAFRTGKITSLYLEEYLIALANEQLKPIGQDFFIQSVDQIKALGESIVGHLNTQAELIPTTRTLGGGSTPSFTKPSYALSFKTSYKPEMILKFFRDYATPILGYIHQDQALFDLSTLLPKDVTLFIQTCQAFLSEARL